VHVVAVLVLEFLDEHQHVRDDGSHGALLRLVHLALLGDEVGQHLGDLVPLDLQLLLGGLQLDHAQDKQIEHHEGRVLGHALVHLAVLHHDADDGAQLLVEECVVSRLHQERDLALVLVFDAVLVLVEQLHQARTGFLLEDQLYHLALLRGVDEYKVDDLHPDAQDVDVVAGHVEDVAVDLDVQQVSLHLVDQVGLHGALLHDEQQVFAHLLKGVAVRTLALTQDLLHEWLAALELVVGDLVDFVFKHLLKQHLEVYALVHVQNHFELETGFLLVFRVRELLVADSFHRDFLVLRVQFVWLLEFGFFCLFGRVQLAEFVYFVDRVR